MGWFDKKKPQNPEKDFSLKKGDPTSEMILSLTDKKLHSRIPAAKGLPPFHEIYFADENAKDSYVAQLIELYEAQAGQSFSYRLEPLSHKPEEAQDARDVVTNILKTLKRLDRFPIDNTPAPTFELPPLNPEFGRAFDDLVQKLLARIDRQKPIIDQVSFLIDGAKMEFIDRTIVDALKAKDEKEFRGKLKDRVMKFLYETRKF